MTKISQFKAIKQNGQYILLIELGQVLDLIVEFLIHLMQLNILIVLGISSFIVGVYILTISLLNSKGATDYHVSCYLSNTTNGQVFQFRTRLQQLKMQEQRIQKLHFKIKSSTLIDPSLHQKSIDLAKNTDFYIQKLALIKKYQQSSRDFFVELANARSTYQKCLNDLKTDSEIDQSRILWIEYLQCFDKYQEIKNQISLLSSKRSKYISQIDSLLVSDPQFNRDFDFESQLKKIQERYIHRNNENNKNKEKYIMDLKRMQTKNQTVSLEVDKISRRYNRAIIQNDICNKNLKEFRKCQDITNTLNQYGYSESIKKIEERVKSKTQMLMQLKQLVIKSRQDGGNSSAMSEMYAKRQKQLKQTIKLRVEIGYEEMKKCGCTEQNRQQLEKDLDSLKFKFFFQTKKLNDIMQEIQKIEASIKQSDDLRSKIIEQYKEETQSLQNMQKSNVLSFKQRLQILKQNLTLVNKQIVHYETNLNQLEFLCNQRKDGLKLKLSVSEKITDCYNRKDFYEKFKSKANLILKKDDKSSLLIQNHIKVGLQSIIYPQNRDIDQQIKIDQALAKRSKFIKEYKLIREPQKIQSIVKEKQKQFNTEQDQFSVKKQRQIDDLSIQLKEL